MVRVYDIGSTEMHRTTKEWKREREKQSTAWLGVDSLHAWMQSIRMLCEVKMEIFEPYLVVSIDFYFVCTLWTIFFYLYFDLATTSYWQWTNLNVGISFESVIWQAVRIQLQSFPVRLSHQMCVWIKPFWQLAEACDRRKVAKFTLAWRKQWKDSMVDWNGGFKEKYSRLNSIYSAIVFESLPQLHRNK